MIKMKNSGYNQNYRMQILKSAFNAFEKMVERSRRKIISPFQDIDRKAQSENGKKIRPLAVQKENDREGYVTLQIS